MNDSTSIDRLLDCEIDPAFASRARFILQRLRETRPKNILDAGCGRGFYLFLLSCLDFPERIVGIDLSPEHVQTARALLAGRPRVEVEEANITALPYESGSFDFIICSEVLEHLPDPSAAVSELFRLLRPGGYLAVSVPHRNFSFLWDPLNWILMRLLGTHIHKDIHWLAGIWADHERLYEESELHALLASRFEVVLTEGVVSNCWPFSHFLLYGLGKNLINAGIFSGLSRFSFERKPGALTRCLASLMAFPDRLFGTDKSRCVNLCMFAKKA